MLVRSAFPTRLKKVLRASLLAVDPRTRRALSEFGLRRYAPVTDEDYRCLRGERGEAGEEGCSAILVATVSGRKRSGRA